ncbi:MAG: Methionine synthase [Firmicutes bacterium ADurb.Bin373]|nr:cobalamin-dependent protein [Bacillota bacterium]OQA09092.1 MAG: Methionine synthase [Firmicutes bacterium ADurb.Bin373]
MINGLIKAIANLEEETTLRLVREKVESGETPLEIVEQCRKGVEIVGKRYSEEIYYLSDLIMSEEIFRGVMEILEPYFPKNTAQKEFKLIMGTIEGDIHDLGKNIVINLLRSVGFEVLDLGVDVQPGDFVECVRETGASVIGISVLLTFSINSVKKVIKLLGEAGLRDKVTVVIGGYPINERIREYTGADYYETDAVKAVELFKRIIMEKEGS